MHVHEPCFDSGKSEYVEVGRDEYKQPADGTHF